MRYKFMWDTSDREVTAEAARGWRVNSYGVDPRDGEQWALVEKEDAAEEVVKSQESAFGESWRT